MVSCSHPLKYLGKKNWVSDSYCFMIAFILIFKGRRIESLWSVSIEILMYMENKCGGNYWYNNRHSAMIFHSKCALPCYSKCGPWTRNLSSTWEIGRNVHPWTPPLTSQVTVCSLTRSQAIHRHIKCKKDALRLYLKLWRWILPLSCLDLGKHTWSHIILNSVLWHILFWEVVVIKGSLVS